MRTAILLCLLLVGCDRPSVIKVEGTSWNAEIIADVLCAPYGGPEAQGSISNIDTRGRHQSTVYVTCKDGSEISRIVTKR